MWRSLLLSGALCAFVTPARAQVPAANQADKKPAQKVLSLEEAYKKEFAFLASQKRELSDQLERSKKDATRQQTKVEAELNGLEGELLRLEEKSRKLRLQLATSEQAAASSDEEKQLVEGTLAQAAVTLADYRVGVPEASDDEARLAALVTVFEKAAMLLKERSSVQIETGEFFLQDGAKVTGKIVKISGVAAYGFHEQGAGALAPAGAGRFKLWRESAEDAATALAQNGDVPADLPIFLFESLNTQVSDEGSETVMDHVAAGGAIAWVIVCLGLFGLLLVAIRSAVLLRAGGRGNQTEERIVDLIQDHQIEEATSLAGRQRTAPGRVLTAALKGLADGSSKLEEMVSEKILSEQRGMHRYGTLILIIAAVSPLLGLLGTVTGMIATFDVITEFGTGDPKMLSGGISTALITTELGLVVAIPMLLLGNLLSGWSERIEADLERAVLRVINTHAAVVAGPQPDQPKQVEPEPEVRAVG